MISEPSTVPMTEPSAPISDAPPITAAAMAEMTGVAIAPPQIAIGRATEEAIPATRVRTSGQS